jgi:predicted transcriptional regulator
MNIDISPLHAQKLSSQALVAGYSSVEDYLANILQHIAEGEAIIPASEKSPEQMNVDQAIEAGLADIAAGNTEPFSKSMAEFREQRGLSRQQ